jgi:hypothetical protein
VLPTHVGRAALDDHLGVGGQIGIALEWRWPKWGGFVLADYERFSIAEKLVAPGENSADVAASSPELASVMLGARYWPTPWFFVEWGLGVTESSVVHIRDIGSNPPVTPSGTPRRVGDVAAGVGPFSTQGIGFAVTLCRHSDFSALLLFAAHAELRLLYSMPGENGTVFTVPVLIGLNLQSR